MGICLIDRFRYIKIQLGSEVQRTQTMKLNYHVSVHFLCLLDLTIKLILICRKNPVRNDNRKAGSRERRTFWHFTPGEQVLTTLNFQVPASSDICEFTRN